MSDPKNSKIFLLPPELMTIIVGEMDIEDTIQLMATNKALARFLAGFLHNLRTANNENLLHGSTMLNNTYITKLLLEVGYEPNVSCDSLGITPLHNAAVEGNAALVELLLKHGANPDPKGTGGCTPLHLAKSAAVVKALVAGGASIDAVNEAAATPLFWAASRNLQEEAEVLLEAGARVGLPDSDNWTPLHCAAAKGYAGIVRALLKWGADPSPADSSALTPLHYAAFNGFAEVAKLLIDAGADADIKDNSNIRLTPLVGAATNGHVDVVKVLLDAGVRETIADALGSAAIQGHVGVMEALIATKDPRVEERKDLALRGAIDKGNVEMVRCLLNGFSNFKYSHIRPIRQAAKENNADLLELFFSLNYDFMAEAQEVKNEMTMLGTVTMVERMDAYIEAKRKENEAKGKELVAEPARKVDDTLPPLSKEELQAAKDYLSLQNLSKWEQQEVLRRLKHARGVRE